MMLVVGLVAFVRALQWYFDPFRELDRAGAVAASTRPPSPVPSRRSQPRREFPPAMPEELALLDAPDSNLQIKAAETLLARAVTPDLVRTVEAKLRTRLDPQVESLLVCVKSRFEEPGTLEYLLSRVPSTRDEFAGRPTAGVSCVVDALAARITEAPERVTAALVPAVYSRDLGMRHEVIQAFRLVDLPSLPAELAGLGREPGELHAGAVGAAVALGALRHNPALVDLAVRDPKLISVVAEDLRTNPHPNGARVLAGVWTDRPAEASYLQLARAREGVLHDVSAALVEIVRSTSAPEPKRIAAAKHLATLGEVGALRELSVFGETVGAGELQTAVLVAIHALQERRNSGVRDQMRALPQ